MTQFDVAEFDAYVRKATGRSWPFAHLAAALGAAGSERQDFTMPLWDDALQEQYTRKDEEDDDPELRRQMEIDESLSMPAVVQQKWFVEKKDGPHEFSSTQVNLAPEDAAAVLRMIAGIADEDLSWDGREDTPHVTVKYGLHADDAGPVRQLVEGFGPIKVKLGKTSLFQSDEHDVVKIDVESGDLVRLNRLLVDNLPNTETYPVYSPHLTLAYVVPGAGDKYAGMDDVDGRELSFTEIVFSSPSGDKTAIPTASYEWAEKDFEEDKGLIFDSVQTAGRWLSDRWAQLENRYGRKQALAMAVAMIGTLPLPGNVAAIVGIAEGIRGLQGYFNKEFGR